MADSRPDALAILGFDPLDPAFLADPHAQFRRLAAAGPLQWTPGGLWVTTSYGLCDRVLRDARFGHHPPTGGMRRGDTPAQSFLTLDPPDHTRLRRLVSKAFGARLIERQRPRIETLVDELLAGATGRVDLISAFAYPLPVIVISELLGVPPEDQERFKGWSDALARGLDPDFLLPEHDLAKRLQARAEFRDYFTELLDRRRAEPRDDLLSELVTVRDGGDLLTTDELLATCILLLVAGHETTVNLIGNGALALLRNPEQLAWFRAHPEAAPAAVEELLRYDPPVQFTMRAALEDVSLGGATLRQGALILLLTSAANRDPAVFPGPDRLDLSRTENRHLAFGLGIHFCLGAPLARLEGQIALTRLFQRDVTLATEALAYRDNVVLRGLQSLPVLM
ncbi:MAG: cytochrome P450 [Actinomadura sp.]